MVNTAIMIPFRTLNLAATLASFSVLFSIDLGAPKITDSSPPFILTKNSVQ